MIDVIRHDLANSISSILNETLKREIDKVLIELHSNLGEVKEYELATLEDAVEFLNTIDLKQIFTTSDSLTLFEPPPVGVNEK